MPTDRSWRRMMSAISSTASGSQVAASPIGVGNAVKLGATTPFNASLWKIAGILRRVEVTRYRWIALTLLAISSGSLCRADRCRRRADALSEQAVHLAGHRPIRSEQRQRNDTGQLHRLFLDRHLTQQLIGALHRGGGGIGRDGCHS
jgi:hypothetical protein